ncbi:MAG TPA: thiamine biosynthesis protein ThiS [Planctomycetaceae bacterium]|nr:thiamine biosynthesis protein ThiS [Planctomycetaceae bacterium]
MRLIINDEPTTFAEGTSVAQLLDQLGLGDTFVAVERNRHIVPFAAFSSTPLEEGDRLEIVTLVGGG